MTIPTADTIPMYACLEGAFVEPMGRNAQKQILPAIVRPEFVNAGQEKINGEGHTLFVTLDKSVLYVPIWENVLILMYLNDQYLISNAFILLIYPCCIVSILK